MRTFFSIFLFCMMANCISNKREKVIVIQPLGDFSKTASKKIFEEIRKRNPSTVLKNNIPFPETTYYKPRHRYRADLLIRFLSTKTGNDSVMVGLSEKDISTTKGKIKDWGVMGLGYCPGNACVVSSFRLSKNNKTGQFYKVALHELGHTQGLPHCPVKTCLMRDAEGGNPLNEEKDFCKTCKAFLKSKNWKFS